MLNGLYQFKVMPFGLTNTPATFQWLMERILMGLQWQTCLVYLDDIIIFSKTFDEHIDHLAEVFSRLKSAGLKLKPKKCSIFKTEVAYLGHIVSWDRISTDPGKTKVVEDWSTPETASDVRSFLGLCLYYQHFVPDFATIVKPLTWLMEKNVPFTWTSAEEESWLKLKNLLTSAPIMAYPDSSGNIHLGHWCKSSWNRCSSLTAERWTRKSYSIWQPSPYQTRVAILYHQKRVTGSCVFHEILQTLPVWQEVPVADGSHPWGGSGILRSQRVNLPGGWKYWTHMTTPLNIGQELSMGMLMQCRGGHVHNVRWTMRARNPAKDADLM